MQNNKVPMNVKFMKYKNNRNNIEIQKILYSHYIQENKKKRQYIKNWQNNNINFLKNKINFKNYNRLTEYEDLKSTNKSFFENSNNKINELNLRKEKYHKSINIPKDRRLLSSENILNWHNKPEMTVLINNGIIKNMYINKDLKGYSKKNINYNKENVFNLKFQNPILFNHYYNNNANNDNIYNLTQINFRENNNNINKNAIKNYINKEKQIDYCNENRRKESIEKYIYNRNNKVKNNMNIKKVNNKIRNQNYIIKDNLIIKNNNCNTNKLNNIDKKTNQFYSNNYNNDEIENISFIPLPFHYMKKNSFGPNKVNNINLKNLKNENQNKNKVLNNKYNYDNNELISSSSEDLSLLADAIITKFHNKNNRNNSPLLGNNNKMIDNYSKFIGIEQINSTKKINTSAVIKDINKIKKRKKKSLMIPMNINNFMIQSHENIKSNDNNNNTNKDLENNIGGNKRIFYAISQNNKLNIQDKNSNKIYNNEDILTQKIKTNLETEYKFNNFQTKEKADKEEKEEKIKTIELDDEDYLIEEIMNKAQNEENNKINRHVSFNIDNNIYINFNSKDLITKKIVIKGNKMLEINNNNEKKMDIYFTLLKSKTKFNPIIKKYDKNELK